jgi:hypothetical protein
VEELSPQATTSDSTSKPLPTEIQQVLTEFGDVFTEPQQLPPRREYDHAISLTPGSTPVNPRPYRYSPLHNSEIECQVAKMLKSGVICQSMSPFASPVLLIQKKDRTCRFCVDYNQNQVSYVGYR